MPNYWVTETGSYTFSRLITAPDPDEALNKFIDKTFEDTLPQGLGLWIGGHTIEDERPEPDETASQGGVERV